MGGGVRGFWILFFRSKGFFTLLSSFGRGLCSGSEGFSLCRLRSRVRQSMVGRYSTRLTA